MKKLKELEGNIEKNRDEIQAMIEKSEATTDSTEKPQEKKTAAELKILPYHRSFVQRILESTVFSLIYNKNVKNNIILKY